MPPKKKPWFRVYVEMVRDAKLHRLTPSQRWLWVVMLAAARESPEPGVLWLAAETPLTAKDLAASSGLRVKETETGIATMVNLGMLTDMGDKGWFVTGWWDRQYESDHRSHH